MGLICSARTELQKAVLCSRRLSHFHQERTDPAGSESNRLGLICSAHTEPRKAALPGPSDHNSPLGVLDILAEAPVGCDILGSEGSTLVEGAQVGFGSIRVLVDAAERHRGRHKTVGHWHKLEEDLQAPQMSLATQDTEIAQRGAAPIADKGCSTSRRDTVSFLVGW